MVGWYGYIVRSNYILLECGISFEPISRLEQVLAKVKSRANEMGGATGRPVTFRDGVSGGKRRTLYQRLDGAGIDSDPADWPRLQDTMLFAMRHFIDASRDAVAAARHSFKRIADMIRDRTELSLPLIQRLGLRCKLLDSAVHCVGDVEVAVIVDCQAVGEVEVAGF